jgi:anti-sigma factor RsiW
MTDHTRYSEDVGAYLLGAMSDQERRTFERHLAGCDECREEVERLRPAADALPGTVEQLEPPPGLKARLMAEVEGDARQAQPKPERERGRRWFDAFTPRRLSFVAAALLIGLVVGFGIAQLGGDDTRTVDATVARAIPEASGTLRVSGDEATLRLSDMPDPGGGRVYQAWVQHGDQLVPAMTFEVDPQGSGEVELPDVSDADGVYVTREARGGAQVPSEQPIVSVPL